MLRNKPKATGYEAQTLPRCYAPPTAPIKFESFFTSEVNMETLFVADERFDVLVGKAAVEVADAGLERLLVVDVLQVAGIGIRIV